MEFYEAQCKAQKVCLPGLRQVRGQLHADTLTLSCPTRFQSEGLRNPAKFRVLEQLAEKFFGPGIRVAIQGPEGDAEKGASAPHDAHLKHPVIRELVEQFQARMISMTPSGR